MSVYIPDELPTFPGGIKAFNQFMDENIRYPGNPEVNFYKGKVKVRMMIDENGQVHPDIIKSLNPVFDSVVVNAMVNMPKWNPARYKGKPVCWYYDFMQGFTITGF
jgi:hypothetical protein